MAEADFYVALGLAPDATAEQIKRRFRKLARECHPDVSGGKPGSHERFVRLSEAYHVLSDPSRRAAYDLTLRDRQRSQEAFQARQGYGRTAEGWPRTPPGGTPPSPRTQ